MQSLAARAVLLDMDGTLVNSDAAVERIWHGWAARHGFDGPYVFQLSQGRQGIDTISELLPDRPREQNWAEARQLLAEETVDLDGVVAVPGAAGFLAALTGLPYALVTSATDGLARARMGAARLPLPPVMVTAEQVSAGKPDPEGFLKAAAELGVDPAGCVVFEDSAAGIAAARGAGMRVVGIGPRAATRQPDLHVSDFTRLRVATTANGAVQFSLAR